MEKVHYKFLIIIIIIITWAHPLGWFKRMRLKIVQILENWYLCYFQHAIQPLT